MIGKTAIMLARQPICNNRQKPFAYELLFRNTTTNRAIIDNSESATAQVIVNSFLEIGLNRIVSKKPTFINVNHNFIINNHYRSLPPRRIVLEIIEDTVPDRELTDALITLRK